MSNVLSRLGLLNQVIEKFQISMTLVEVKGYPRTAFRSFQYTSFILAR